MSTLTADFFERSQSIVTWISVWWSQVSGTVQHGFEITIVGMALVFFTLGLVIVAMVLLTKLPWLQDKEQRQKPETASDVEATDATPEIGTTTSDDEFAQVAAIAIAMLTSRRASDRRARARATRSAWKSYGRSHQLGL
jgi:sodium pump decarboxylase gamma subunit